VGFAPFAEPSRPNYFANVAAHEVDHQFGLHIFKAGTLMTRPSSLEAICTGLLTFSEADAAILRDALN
jgi:hypothetical protein